MQEVGDSVSGMALFWAAIGAAIVVVAIWVQLRTQVTTFYPAVSRLVAIYLKLLFSPLYKDGSWKKKIKPEMKLNPDLTFNIPFVPDVKNASDFAKICELNFDTKDELVPFYPATMFLYPTVCLLSSRKYLFPVLGAIHVRNYFRFQRPLKSTEAYKGVLKVNEDVVLAKRGVEVTFPQLLLDAKNAEVWRSTSTVLVQGKHKFWSAETSPKPPMSYLEVAKTEGADVTQIREKEWSFPGNRGIEYAKVVNDWNPIHLTPWTAKLFGFPRAIAHGMYVTTRAFHEALEEYNKAGLSYPLESEVRFRKPVLLPSTPTLKVYRVKDKSGALSMHYVVEKFNKKDNKVETCLEGFVRSCKA